MKTSFRAFVFVASSLFAAGCGSSEKTAESPHGERAASAEEVKAATKPCGKSDEVHTFDLHDDKADEALAPCSGEGGKGNDYSGLVKVESVEGGVKVTIDARDDEVNLLGADVKKRDAVIVYPKGKGEQGVEVPLTKTPFGYHGEKIVEWDNLHKLTDDGTRIDVAIFDHDPSSGKDAEELHVSLVVSTGKSCEKARDENVEEMTIGKKGSRDLTANELGAPMSSSGFMGGCGLSDSANADICAAVKNGKAVGVSVGVTPKNNKVAACIDRAVRKLHFPASPKLDIVHQKF